MTVGGRAEYLTGLVFPILLVIALAIVGMNSATPAVAIAFMASAPMLAAMFTRALLTGIVALVTVLAAGVTAAATYGADFYDALAVLIGVIVAAGIAVLASQAKAAPASGRPSAPAAAGAGSAPSGSTQEPDTDDLTGLPTRAGVLPALRSEPVAGPRVLAIIDCDHLAVLNDEHGRAIGDTFLFAVAGRTRYALPEGDVVARWDGEEFLVVIAGDIDSSRPLLELITDKVNKNPIRTDAGLLPQAMSVGAAAWPEGQPFDEALENARRALYRAKAEGGARLVVAEEPSA
jgi:diguanylate cyclase (GGDEF)-like protein